MQIWIEYIALIIESIGVMIIVFGIIRALGRAFSSRSNQQTDTYRVLRQDIGKAILLGLEILVAADIIATVVTDPTMQTVLVLGLIVLIRTFLSFSLQVELEGKMPWQPSAGEKRKV